MEKEHFPPWLAFGMAAGVLVIGATLALLLSYLVLHRPRHAPNRPASPLRTQVTDFGGNGVLTIAFGSGMGFPGATFEERGRRLMAKRFGSAAAPSRSLGLVRPPVILGAGPLSIKGRKAYYHSFLREFPRPGGAVHLINATVLVDCPERGATGVVVLSLRAPPGRQVGAGADLRGTPADPQFLTGELELSSAQLCTFR